MIWRDWSTRRRAAAVGVALMLFLSGSNLCLISVLCGGSMDCLAAPTAGGHAGASHCGHAGGKHGPVRSTASSCCVTVAQVPGPQVEKIEIVSLESPLSLVAVAEGAPHLDLRSWVTPEQKPPPLAILASRHSGRAPPISS